MHGKSLNLFNQEFMFLFFCCLGLYRNGITCINPCRNASQPLPGELAPLMENVETSEGPNGQDEEAFVGV